MYLNVHGVVEAIMAIYLINRLDTILFISI